MRLNNLETAKPRANALPERAIRKESGVSARPAAIDCAERTGVQDFRGLTDKKLVSCFVDTRDERAFSELVGRYADKLYGTALRITHNPSAAEDVLQEVFIILVEKLHTFSSEYKFSTWLYRVAANASFTHLRSEKKHKNSVSFEEYLSGAENGMGAGVELSSRVPGSDEALSSREWMEKIERAVSELPAAYRAVFHLRDIEGLSNVEVAEILNLTLPNVKSRIHRARLVLRNKLSDYSSN
jgi:RNA polymerase sigma-70 factor (ECF subfamily)